MSSSRKQATVYLEYQPYIDFLPIPTDNLYQQACANDATTVNSWKDVWISQTKANRAVHGPFKDRSLGLLYKKHLHQPCFLLGSGPSLKKNVHLLKSNHGIPVISCLHNFHYLEDQGIPVDYYVTLDAGAVTIDEISEGGDASKDYWAMTKGKKLLAFIGSHPNLLAKWQGEIYFFNCPIPSKEIEDELDKIERFKVLVSTGGNVLGASLYIAKAFLGCNTTIFLGADFSFSYEEKFHAWDSKYDANLGHVVKMRDIYGIPVKTWQSYANFKAWFDWVSQKVPGNYINCTEGGTFGAYNEGNLRSVKQMDLVDCLKQFTMSDYIKDQVQNPDNDKMTILF
jgi:Uncharacterized protein conserved in bacteria